MVVVNVRPVVTFFMSTSQMPVDCSVMETLTVSPPLTASEIVRVDCGKVSVQASYSIVPSGFTVASVPAWMRSVVLAPPTPTQVASTPATFGSGFAMTHVPLTEVKVPPVATYPDQFRDVPRTVVLVGPCGWVGATTAVPGWVLDAIFQAPASSTSE